MKARLDTLVTHEVDYPAWVKVEELGIKLILVGYQELEVFEVKNLAQSERRQFGWLFGKA